MLRTPVPKASVNEDDDALLTEQKIGFAVQVLIPAPTLDTAFTKNSHQLQLGRFVAFAAD